MFLVDVRLTKCGIIPENCRSSKFLPDYYKIEKMYDNAVDSYCHGLEFIRKCYKMQHFQHFSFCSTIYSQML